LPLGFSSRHSPSTQRFITREPTLPKPRRLDNPTQYLRENRLSRRPGVSVSPARPSSHRLAIPRRGGLRTPARKAPASPRHIPARPPAVRLRIGLKWNVSAFVRPYQADARSASLRENHLPRRLGASSFKAGYHRQAPAEGRAPHAREEGRLGLDRGMSPLATGRVH
jgi:hypothetical protein